MSGIEVAGLVLGAIPLVLAGLQFYGEGIAVTKRYWKYREEIKSLLIELRAEHTMCVNSINMLLIGVVSQKDMAEFLTDPGGDQWKETKFDKKLRKRLGTTYDSYLDTMKLMASTAEQFKLRLKLDASGKPQFSQVSAFKEHYKRLKFSLSQSDYADLMHKIRQANVALYRMTTQTAYLDTYQTSTKAGQTPIPRFQIIKDRAEEFYSALSKGWKCPCYADHSVNLRLEPRMDDDGSGDDSDEDEEVMRDPFHVLFRFDHRYHPHPKAAMMDVPWMWEEADVRVEFEKQSDTATSSMPSSKGVRFAKQAKQAVRAALDPDPNMKPIKDLCSAICELQKPDRDICFSLLANEISQQKYGVHIYPIKKPPIDTALWSVSSLRTILNDSNFPRRDRLKLALTLSSSVLQLHETPWLDDNWGKDTIFFVNRPGKTLYDQPFVSQHFNHSMTSSTTSLPASMSRIIRNQTLYGLGVALIELWYGKSLSELHQDADGLLNTGNAQMDLMTEWNTADRLVDELYGEAGAKYSNAVRRCIRCDFDRRGNSLEDKQFQRAVFEGVVAELKENYEFLHPQPA